MQPVDDIGVHVTSSRVGGPAVKERERERRVREEREVKRAREEGSRKRRRERLDG